MNRVIHFDISADDPAKVAKFYTDVFGWKIEKVDMPPLSEESAAQIKEMIGEENMDADYWLIETGPDSEPGINGGLSKRMTEVGQNKAFVNTIGVENLEESVEKIKAAGGEVEYEKMPIPGMGWFARAKDPDGNFFGIMQEDKEAK